MKTEKTDNQTQPLEWNQAIGLCARLKNDGLLRDYLLIIIGIHVGMRIGDLRKLRFADLLDKEEFTVTEKKTGKVRRITINPTVKEAVRYVTNVLIKKGKFDPESYLFANRWGNPISVSYINKRLPVIFKRYKIKCVGNESTHILRKTFAMAVFNSQNKSEQALITLSQIFNHSSTAITRLYIGITQETIANIYISI